jgi:hypothetical protein
MERHPEEFASSGFALTEIRATFLLLSVGVHRKETAANYRKEKYMKLKQIGIASGLLALLLISPIAQAQTRHSAAWYRTHRDHNASWYRTHRDHSESWYRTHGNHDDSWYRTHNGNHSAAWYRTHRNHSAEWYRQHPGE